jgi:hypothetical protein
MEFEIPLWALVVGVIFFIIVAWKLIKFAIKAFILIIVFLALIIGLDVLGVINWIKENILSSFL